MGSRWKPSPTYIITLNYPHHPNPKNQRNIHQNLENEHFYEVSKSAHGGKWKWRMRGKREGSLTIEVNSKLKKITTTRSLKQGESKSQALQWRVFLREEEKSKMRVSRVCSIFQGFVRGLSLSRFLLFTPITSLNSPTHFSWLNIHPLKFKHSKTLSIIIEITVLHYLN